MAAVLLLLASLAAAAPFPEAPQDPKALAVQVKKALRLGKDGVVPTAEAAVHKEIANANLSDETYEEQDVQRGFKETGPDQVQGNLLGIVMDAGAMGQTVMDKALSETAEKSGGRYARLSLAGLPAHTPAKLLQARSPGPPIVTHHLYVLTDKVAPAPKVLRLVFRRIDSDPGTMDVSRPQVQQEWGKSVSCWYIAEPDGALREAKRVGDGKGECRAYCAELEFWLGTGCRADGGWLDRVPDQKPSPVGP